ncbi:MAG: transcription elongation factor GreA [Treponema sp.]|nr:MAG: transcription elongation factor GreA [Treponema sp.]
MSETLKKKLTEMLNEETWTRAAINKYSIADFKELDKIISETKKEDGIEELSEMCSEHLVRSKNSIIALYISSIISLLKQDLDDSNFRSLIEIFTENRRMQIVEHLCLRVLEFGDSKFALRTLADYYKASDNSEIYGIWERLVKIDYDEAEIPRLIAEKYEEEGNLEKAIEYYKKSLYRFINKKQNSGIKELWNKLVTLIPEDIDFFYHVQNKISSVMGNSKTSFLMHDVYIFYKEKQEWDICIDILKMMLQNDTSDSWARTEIIECFKNKYADHSQLDEYIKVSNLTQTWRSVFDAIADFEKHISFDTGNFVFHRTWGVGRISKVDGETLYIDFAKKRGHEMSLKMGLNALQTLSKEHIWVLKATSNKEELAKKVKTEHEWALKTIISSFDNNCDMKKIKQEIVPSLLTQGEWATWNTKSRKILKENPVFGISSTNIDSFMVRERPISLEEKLSNEFKAQKNFFSRIEIVKTFMEKCDTETEAFHDMFNYFDGFLKAFNQVNEQVVASYLLVTNITSSIPHLNSGKKIGFVTIYSQIEDPVQLYASIKDKSLKVQFLRNIKNLIANWNDEFIKLFPTVLSQSIIDDLINDGHTEQLQNFVRECFENYKVYREAVIWFFKNCQEEDWFKGAGIELEKQMIALVHILDITFREIDSRKNTTENRKINKQVHTLLFGKDNLLENFIIENDEATITRLYTLIGDIDDLDSAVKMRLRNKIVQKYKEFKFFESEEKEVVTQGLIVTTRMFDVKNKELQEILDVKIPQNQKDLAYAISLGDLRENAEYKAAREEQAQLNNAVSRLQGDIDRAQIFDPTTVSTKKVGFGTKITVENIDDNSIEEYTILGPWESAPENGIISYMSPLGSTFINSKKDETVKFAINEQKKTYKILNIAEADLS